MPFTEISLINFRNSVFQKIPVHYEQVFFVGPNGQGKTNFLEAVYLLSYGSSFRSRRDDVLVNHNADEMAVHGRWRDPGTKVDSDIYIRYLIRKKDIRINDTPVRDRKELAEKVPCIVFSHDDIEFVKGAPDNQRWFFNQCLSTYRISFIDSLRNYNRILKTRNQIIKDRSLDLIGLYDAQIAGTGLEIQKARRELVRDFNGLFTPLFAAISGIEEEVRIVYRPSWKSDDAGEIEQYLGEHLERDLTMNTSTSGPHRDRFSFRIAGRDFLLEASTGQLRLMSLILRAAQARLYAQMTSRAPVLLLDDVLLELDGEKRRHFMKELPRYQQAFFTFLPDENISNYLTGSAIIYRVSNGEYHPVEIQSETDGDS